MTGPTAGCLCGAVRIRMTGSPYRGGLCHFLDCRKHHGALFHASAIFPNDTVAVGGRDPLLFSAGTSDRTADRPCSGGPATRSRSR